MEGIKTKYIDADLLRKDIDNWKKAMADAVGEYSDGVRFALEHFTFVLDSLQQEYPKMNIPSSGSGAMGMIPPKFKLDVKPVQPEVDLEKAARHVYESWMGGTMDDVRRDMVKLGTVLNARKEE